MLYSYFVYKQWTSKCDEEVPRWFIQEVSICILFKEESLVTLFFRKRYYNDTPILPSAESFSKGAVEGKKSTNSKRVNVLNKLFMRHITDLMATGENARQFAGFGIEINRVKVTEDFKLVQVFWGAKGTESDDVIGSLLSKNAGKIRHQLTELRVIGMVPKIMFCKDKQLAQLIEIEKNLEKADFGDDYIRPDPVAKLKTQLELNISLDPRIKVS